MRDAVEVFVGVGVVVRVPVIVTEAVLVED
jgi:hypothetical protein